MSLTLSGNLPRRIAARLHAAISRQNYSRIYKQLSLCTQPFPPETAALLLGSALEKGLSRKVFEAILQKSPPVPKVLSAFANISRGPMGLAARAAYRGRADVLSLLLERGAGPNRTCGAFSPLEAALLGQSLESVKLLLRQPELDTGWTVPLLREWARPRRPRSGLEACIRAMAPRFTGWYPLSGQPLPFPEPMTSEIIAKAHNWPLLERFCREQAPLPLEEAREAVGALCHAAIYRNRDEDRSGYAAALDALLESCPDLMRRETDCQALLRCFFLSDEDVRKRLLPRMARLRRRRIAMPQQDWAHWGYDGLPELWHRLLPNGPTLVIDRWSDGFLPLWDNELLCAIPLSGETLRHILDTCPVRGKSRKGKLSPLAASVLCCSDTALIASLLQPGGLLATEDPGALTDFVLKEDLPRATRAVVLSHVRREEDYDL